MSNPDHATVSDILQIMVQLEEEGLGDYVVTCNDEYTLAKKNDLPTIDSNNQTIDLGGYDD